MKKLIGLCVAMAMASTGGLAARAADKVPGIVAQSDRVVAGGRPVGMSLPQRQIGISIDVGRIAESANGGGALGWFIISRMDDRRETMSTAARLRAEAAAGPLRQTLERFDVDALALATTKVAFAKPDWFQARDIVASKDTPSENQTALYASVSAPQYAFIDYHYDLSPDFTQIRVFADLRLARQVMVKGKIAGPPQIFYRQFLASIVQLRERSYEPRENAARWAADDGKLAKSALTTAFARLQTMIPYALSLSQADVDDLAAKKHEKAYAAGFYGSLIARDKNDPDDVLIWSKGLVHSQPTS
jgi:hypothetical protein